MAKLATDLSKAELEKLISRQILDEDEQDIERALRSLKRIEGNGRTAANKDWRQVLANTERKSPVTLRVSDDVMRRIRLKARTAGLPYQTLINSVLHKFAHGRMKDVE